MVEWVRGSRSTWDRISTGGASGGGRSSSRTSSGPIPIVDLPPEEAQPATATSTEQSSQRIRTLIQMDILRFTPGRRGAECRGESVGNADGDLLRLPGIDQVPDLEHV